MVNADINLLTGFSRRKKLLDRESKKLISITFWISFVDINAPNIMVIVIVLAMI